MDDSLSGESATYVMYVCMCWVVVAAVEYIDVFEGGTSHFICK